MRRFGQYLRTSLIYMKTMRDAAISQQIPLRISYLHRIKTKQICYRLIKISLFTLIKILP